MQTKHQVVLDYAGFQENIPRLTCYSEGCNCATLVRQPYMSDLIWQNSVTQFQQLHPHSSSLSWSQYQIISR
ncbi:hypothetical protein [Laspinema olomoucense]|uniref:hypothetical protein n=1 Tax=Laspinema olomoucense TaxID=3231600 RepID=UPI0021BB2E90|nr:hypothetical protein [Laspinema sp. D3d]MCT7971262.1 hypothetical protein [Laspinema sp. D3d]